MDPLSQGDHRKIATLARGLYSSGSAKATSERLVQGLDDLIGGTSVLISRNNAYTKACHTLAGNMKPEFHQLLREANTFIHEHPGVRYHCVYEGRAVCFEMGMQEQLGASLVFAFPDLMSVVLAVPAARYQ